jgi:hypothetical protein
MILALVALSWPGAAGATAATRGHASDPAPQKAPTSGASSQPTPDPAPQANTTSSPPPHRSTVSSPTIRVPVITTPARTVVVTPTTTVSAPATKIVASHPHQPARPTSPAHARAHRAATPRHAQSQATPLSFPLAIPRDLLLLPGTALGAGTTGHRNGVLLLLSSVAMAVVAVASFTLLRRLRRLELR